MKSFATVVALLSLASLGASSATPSPGFVPSCKASDRVLVEARNGQVFNACAGGETTRFTCMANQGAGPLEADCVALENALPAFAATQNPFSFTVLPQFIQEFALGTCLFAWINTNPVGGATLQYCYAGVEANGITLDGNCIFPGDTGGVAIPSNPQLNPVVLAWVFERLAFLHTRYHPLSIGLPL
ncbi:hypothetical protein DFH09DRAFT_1186909 [Mycena vulgaris]|nr:hypothetical protein DFH09DRAFT_1186909 [Mycena vulgaris]